VDTVINDQICKNSLNSLGREGFFRLSARTPLFGTAEFCPVMEN